MRQAGTGPKAFAIRTACRLGPAAAPPTLAGDPFGRGSDWLANAARRLIEGWGAPFPCAEVGASRALGDTPAPARQPAISMSPTLLDAVRSIGHFWTLRPLRGNTGGRPHRHLYSGSPC